MRIPLLLSVFAFLSIARAQVVNVWTNATSSPWEFQTNWSLGMLPDQSQSVYITNAGFKAVEIRANTAQNFPQSMQIQDLQIASPVDSFNELLMNFSGFTVPLQTTSLNIGSNSAVVVLSSMLQSSNIFVGGNFIQGDFSQVTVHGPLGIANGSSQTSGTYYLTNGTLSVEAGMSMGGFGAFGKFIQYGGYNNVGGVRQGDEINSGSIILNVQGEIDLYGGQLTATNGILVGYGDFANTSSFNQYGGSVNADMVINGHYTLSGGAVTGRMSVINPGSFQRANAVVLQTGGTNSAVSLSMGQPNRFGGRGDYTLSNGVLSVESSLPIRGSQFSQYNGQVTIVSNLLMTGVDIGLGIDNAKYVLDGGTLSSAGVTEDAAQFDQNGGTNLIAGDLALSATLLHSFSSYALGGGLLSVHHIYINANTYFQHAGGNIIHSGMLNLNQGTWWAAPGDYTLGPLQLSGQTNSAINFPGGPSILRLANSSTQPWVPGALLYISNWEGSTSGGGATQLYFGSNSSGLTAQQLAQIRFNLASGLQPANILPTGEVVPVLPPAIIQFTRNGNALILTWPSGGWFLQSATTVTGPYNDVSGATSPWPVSMTNSQAFFRLRQ